MSIPQLVQFVTGAGATLTLNNVRAGNFLVVWDSYFRNPSTGVGEAAPTDSNGTFSVARADAPAVQASQDAGVGIFYQEKAKAGTHTVTPEANTGHNTTLAEFTNMPWVSSIDATVTSGKGTGTGTSQSTGVTPATAQPYELSIAAFCMAANTTGAANVGLTDPVNPYTTLQLNQNDATDVVTQHIYTVLSAVGTQEVVFNWTNSEADQFWEGAIVTFRAAPDPIGVLPNFGSTDHPGRGPGFGNSSQRFTPSNWWPYTASVLANPVMVADVGVYVFTGIASVLEYGRVLAAATGAYTYTGNAATLNKGFTMPADTGVYLLTGNSINFLRGLVLTAAKGTYTYNGNSANTLVGRVVTAGVGTYLLTGNAAGAFRTYVLTAAPGTYNYVGNAATLIYSANPPATSGNDLPWLRRRRR